MRCLLWSLTRDRLLIPYVGIKKLQPSKNKNKTINSRIMSTSRIAQAAIKIPKRIERGPTDILKALASTVRNIPNEPDSLLQDDPYLLPRRPQEKPIFALSKLNGQSAARFLLNKHPEMFFRDDSEPKIEAFLPPEEYRYDMDFTEEDIKWCIEHNDAVNGIIAYKTLETKDIKISDETLLDFFELICYTNEEKMLEQVEFMRHFYSRDNDRQLVNLTWKTTGTASAIFNKIKEDLDPPRVYSSMIAGLSKYNEHEAAKEVFNDFKERHPDKGLFPEAYDALISSVPKISSSMSTTHEAIDNIISHMEQQLVMPNLRIFNSILDCYRRFICDVTVCQKAFKLINDMRALNIAPSLSSYDSLFTIIFKFKGGRSYNDLVGELLDHINSREELLVVRDERDALFLRNCMRLFSSVAHNLQLASKLHKIFMKRPNLFSSNGQKHIYLDMYFRLIVTTEKLENILNFYELYVPMNFRPSPDTYDALAEALDLYQADESIVKKIGQDLIQYRLADKVKNDAIYRKNPDYVEALEKSLVR